MAAGLSGRSTASDARSVASRLVPGGRDRRPRHRGAGLVRAAPAPGGAVPLAVGGLVWLAVLGAVLAAVAPGGSYLAAIPALAGGAGRARRRPQPWRGLRLAAALLAGASPWWCSRRPWRCSSRPRPQHGGGAGLRRDAAAGGRVAGGRAALPARGGSGAVAGQRRHSGGGRGSCGRLRPDRAVGRPVRRRSPGADPPGLRARHRPRPGVVGEHRDGSWNLDGALRPGWGAAAGRVPLSDRRGGHRSRVDSRPAGAVGRGDHRAGHGRPPRVRPDRHPAAAGHPVRDRRAHRRRRRRRPGAGGGPDRAGGVARGGAVVPDLPRASGRRAAGGVHRGRRRPGDGAGPRREHRARRVAGVHPRPAGVDAAGSHSADLVLVSATTPIG